MIQKNWQETDQTREELTWYMDVIRIDGDP